MPSLLALALTLSFTGCHGTLASGENPAASSSYPVPDEFDTSRRYEVTFWAKNDTNMAQVNIYKQAIADFEALYPNITVNLRLYTDYGKIYNDVITNIATDTTPNVCITYPDHIATYLTGEDTVVPLDDLFADEKYGLGGSEVRFDSPTQAEIIPQFLSECAINGHYYAIPYMRSTEACYVNKTYVEKLGYTLPDVLTWDFVWEVSEAAMAKDSAGNFLLNGQKVLIPFIDKSTDNMMIQMLKQRGAGYSTRQRRGAAVQRHHGRNSHNNCRARRLRGVQHLQAGRLSRQFPQRRAVHFRHRLHCRRDMDGRRRPPHRHCRGKADPL